MLTKIDFNPYAFLTAPKAYGIYPAYQKPIKMTVDDTSFGAVYNRVKQSNAAQYETYKAVKDDVPSGWYPDCALSDEQRVDLLFRLAQRYSAMYITCDNVDAKLEELWLTAGKADNSGMSTQEKVMAIFDKYDHAFGDWQKCFGNLYGTHFNGVKPDYAKIRDQFWDEIIASGINPASISLYSIRKTAVYGKMSDSEIRAAIVDKYPSMSEITLREFYSLVGEMSSVGVDAGLFNVMLYANQHFFCVDGILAREMMLDNKLDIEALCRAYNEMHNAMLQNSYTDVGNSGTVLRELFGVTFDLYGNAYTDYKTPIDIKELIEQFIKTSKLWEYDDYDKWVDALL